MTDPEPVRVQIRQARQALDDATGAREADLSDSVVVNRLYYGCFHAAKAVLYERGYEPDSHGGDLSLFGSEVVVDGAASRAQGRLLNDLSTLRKQADYGYEPIDEDIDDLVDRAGAFVDEMEQLVDGAD